MGKTSRLSLEERAAQLAVHILAGCAANPDFTDLDIAEMILLYFQGERVSAALPAILWMHSSITRTRGIGRGLLDLAPNSVTALTYNAALRDDHEAATLLTRAIEHGGGAGIEADLAQLLFEMESSGVTRAGAGGIRGRLT